MKIRVFFPIFIIIQIFVIIDLGIWLWIIFSEGFETFDLLSFVFFIAMMGCLPLGLYLWSLATVTNVIEFSEYGVSRIRFGKVIRYFKWEEIQTLDSTEGGAFAGWIYISNKDKSYDYQHVGKMRGDREVIYFHQSKKALKALQTYAPERFNVQINQWTTN